MSNTNDGEVWLGAGVFVLLLVVAPIAVAWLDGPRPAVPDIRQVDADSYVAACAKRGLFYPSTECPAHNDMGSEAVPNVPQNVTFPCQAMGTSDPIERWPIKADRQTGLFYDVTSPRYATTRDHVVCVTSADDATRAGYRRG